MDAQHRLHALDNLRAHMMLLGVVFHTGINYAGGEPQPSWPFRDAATDQGIAVLLDFLHVFRMPVFFMVAGFFTVLLIRRRSLQGLLKNRSQRILIPFLLFLLPVSWLCSNGVQAGLALMEGGQFEWRVPESIGDGSLFHFWFLYFLLIYYVVLALGWWCCQLLGVGLSRWLQSNDNLLIRHGPLLWGPLVGMALYGYGSPRVSAPDSFAPGLPVLLYYGVFFAAGACLYGLKTPLQAMCRHMGYWWALLLVGAVGLVAAEMVVLTPSELEDRSYSLAGGVFQGIFTCSLCFLVMGLYLRYGNKQSPFTRYFTDASYWVYLVHLPLTLWLPLWIADWQWGAWAKFGFCVMVITAVCVVSYHLLVRSTALGRLLNGRQYPFTLPLPARNGYNVARQS
ncbi:MAG: acyltransferase family protein [Ketobacteraceae bacterium]|nr:acyltransferase family protein [Ketobacteraceae bacterium]